jgi:hypothetical protein
MISCQWSLWGEDLIDNKKYKSANFTTNMKFKGNMKPVGVLERREEF